MLERERFGVASARRSRGLTWLWPGRLPALPVILEGRGGLGKSTVVTDLAARISTGGKWPDGTPCPKGGVLLVGIEEFRDQQQEKLEAAGWSPTVKSHGPIERVIKLNVVDDWDQFEKAIKEIDCRLCVIDPAVDFLGVDLRNEDSTRWILAQLSALCEKYSMCVILIRHMRKDANDQDPMEDGGRGTGALRNFVRVVYRLIHDPDDETNRLFMATKFNLAEFPSTLVFHQESDRKGRPKVVWHKAASRWNAFNLIGRLKDEVKRQESRECDVWMKEYFAANYYRAKAKEVLKAGSEEGYSASIIKRTRVRLGIRSHKLNTFNGAWLWTHPLYDESADPGDPTGIIGGMSITIAP